jgi:hypothetical protein
MGEHNNLAANMPAPERQEDAGWYLLLTKEFRLLNEYGLSAGMGKEQRLIAHRSIDNFGF